MSNNKTTPLIILAGALAAIASGCMGGSGSSGFDLIESAAIQRVVETQECEDLDGLLLCAADTAPGIVASPTATEVPTEAVPTHVPTEEVPTPVPTEDVPTATPTTTESDLTPMPTGTLPGVPATETATETPLAPTDTPTVQPTVQPSVAPTTPDAPAMREILTNRASYDATEALCIVVETGSCEILFEFTPSGFDGDAAFRIATRLSGEDGWTIGAPVNLGALFGLSYSVPIPIDVAFAQAAISELQIIVLGFESDPGPVPERVERLSDTGADWAFAVEPLSLIAP